MARFVILTAEQFTGGAPAWHAPQGSAPTCFFRECPPKGLPHDPGGRGDQQLVGFNGRLIHLAANERGHVFVLDRDHPDHFSAVNGRVLLPICRKIFHACGDQVSIWAGWLK
jgi:hypothetical protein